MWTGLSGLGKQAEMPTPEPVEQKPKFSETVKHLAQAGLEHAEALMEVFQIELKEAVKRLEAKIIWLVLCLFTALFAYALLWGLIIVLIGEYLNYFWAFGIAFLYHAIIALVSCYLFKRTSVGPVAPDTVKELKADYTCLKMTIKGN